MSPWWTSAILPPTVTPSANSVCSGGTWVQGLARLRPRLWLASLGTSQMLCCIDHFDLGFLASSEDKVMSLQAARLVAMCYAILGNSQKDLTMRFKCKQSRQFVSWINKGRPVHPCSQCWGPWIQPRLQPGVRHTALRTSCLASALMGWASAAGSQTSLPCKHKALQATVPGSDFLGLPKCHQGLASRRLFPSWWQKGSAPSVTPGN